MSTKTGQVDLIVKILELKTNMIKKENEGKHAKEQQTKLKVPGLGIDTRKFLNRRILSTPGGFI